MRLCLTLVVEMAWSYEYPLLCLDSKENLDNSDYSLTSLWLFLLLDTVKLMILCATNNVINQAYYDDHTTAARARWNRFVARGSSNYKHQVVTKSEALLSLQHPSFLLSSSLGSLIVWTTATLPPSHPLRGYQEPMSSVQGEEV